MLELGDTKAGTAFENRAAAVRWHPDRKLWFSNEEKRFATKVFQLHGDVFVRKRSELASSHGNASVRVSTAQQRRAKDPVASPRTMYQTPDKQARSDSRSTPVKTSPAPDRAAEQGLGPSSMKMPASSPPVLVTPVRKHRTDQAPSDTAATCNTSETSAHQSMPFCPHHASRKACEAMPPSYVGGEASETSSRKQMASPGAAPHR